MDWLDLLVVQGTLKSLLHHYSLFIYLFLIFIFTLFYFTILYWFCHTLTWIQHGCICVPKHEPPPHFPPHNISLGHPRAPAPSMLYPASDIGWWFDSYMIVYMLQCHSLKSSHPLPLPLSPKVHYTHLCLLLSCIQGCHLNYWGPCKWNIINMRRIISF